MGPYNGHDPPGLRSIVNPALDSVSTDLMQKYFRRVWEYEKAYQSMLQAGSCNPHSKSGYKLLMTNQLRDPICMCTPRARRPHYQSQHSHVTGARG